MSQEKKEIEKIQVSFHCPLWDVRIKISIQDFQTAKLSEKDAAKICPYFILSCGEEYLGNTGCCAGRGNEVKEKDC